MKYALIYGGIAGAVIIGIAVAGIAFNFPGHHQSEWFGYLVMLAGLSLIFVGVKRYRDVECGGVIRFWRALAVGLGIAMAASVVYVAGWELYVAVSHNDYMAAYSAAVLRGMREHGATAAAIQAKAAELSDMTARYHNPLFRMPMTFLEIAPVGLIVALVTAAILRNPRVLPARAAKA